MKERLKRQEALIADAKMCCLLALVALVFWRSMGQGIFSSLEKFSFYINDPFFPDEYAVFRQ
ncbi:hypothetical protein ACEQPO_05380 [Bacillus sp. SL00103]